MVSYVRDEPFTDLPQWSLEDKGSDISLMDGRYGNRSALGRDCAIPLTGSVSRSMNCQSSLRMYGTDQACMSMRKLSLMLQEALNRCRISNT